MNVDIVSGCVYISSMAADYGAISWQSLPFDCTVSFSCLLEMFFATACDLTSYLTRFCSHSFAHRGLHVSPTPEQFRKRRPSTVRPTLSKGVPCRPPSCPRESVSVKKADGGSGAASEE